MSTAESTRACFIKGKQKKEEKEENWRTVISHHHPVTQLERVFLAL